MNFATIKKVGKQVRSSEPVLRTAQRALIVLAAIFLSTLSTPAQAIQKPDGQSGQIFGTVTDIRGDAVSGATVILASPDSTERKTIVTGDNGFFEFDDVKPGVSYKVAITADGFAEWTSPPVTIEPGHDRLLGDIVLQLEAQNTSMTVTDNPLEIATEQVKAEEKQRILGVFPNYLVSYEGSNASPLTSKMKFQLALKVSFDPVTISGVALVAGIRQAFNSPNYPQGAKGYGERFGAVVGDGFSDIMLREAIFPSLLHEDPRYFYRGTGSTKSRLVHALSSPFICKRDNGSWGPNYASLGGDLAAGAIANLYFPKSNRGVRLVFSQFAIATAEGLAASVLQEFVLGKLTHRGGHAKEASIQ